MNSGCKLELVRLDPDPTLVASSHGVTAEAHYNKNWKKNSLTEN